MAPRAPVLRLIAQPHAYGRFVASRQRMLRELGAWITEDRPPPDLVEAEAQATINAVTQIGELLAGTFLVTAGRCTRCHYALGDHAYMVRERIVGEIRYDPSSGHGFILHDFRNVPVCEVCVTDRELNLVSHEQECGGCGRRLSMQRRWISRRGSMKGDQRPVRAECSDACFRRVLHKRARIKDLTCTVCKEEFASARKDAKYCSGACRQWAYRLREFAAVSP